MLHASMYRPNILPITGDVAVASMARIQTLTPTVTLNREKVEEVGRDGVVGYVQKVPGVSYAVAQHEYGSIEFWQKIINSDVLGNSGQTAITLGDFKTPYFDVCAYLTDDDGTFTGTVWYPSLRPASFSVSIGDPEAIIARAFTFVGDAAHIFQGNNKYFIHNKDTAVSGDVGDWAIDLAAIPPSEDPDNTGTYMFRVVKYKGGITTEIVSGSASGEYSYSDSTNQLTVHGTAIGDIINAYYTSSVAPTSQFTLNDSDPAALAGDSASIYLYVPASGKPSSSDYIYRLQSAEIAVSFTREDIKEIGNTKVVARGVSESVVTVTLGRTVEKFTIEEVLRGVAADYGNIDVSKLSDQITLIAKIFTDNTKGTLAYGFKATGLTATELGGGAAVNSYSKRSNTLTGEDLSITADNTLLGSL